MKVFGGLGLVLLLAVVVIVKPALGAELGLVLR